MSRVIATIEARMGSSRLPGKVLMTAAGRPLLSLMVERVRRARYLDEVVVATGEGQADDPVADLCRREGIACFRGSDLDVQRRVVEAGRRFSADVSVLLTGDCPLSDALVIDQHVAAFLAARLHVALVTNCEVRSFPHGLDLLVMAWTTLEESERATRGLPPTHPFREHSGWFVRRHPARYPRQDIVAPPGFSIPSFRITLDHPEDYERIRTVYEELYPRDPSFSTADILELGRRRGWIDA